MEKGKTNKKLIEIERRIDKIEIDIKDMYKVITGEEDVNIECSKCSYSWYSRSRMKTVSCPNCGAKVKRETKAESDKIVNKFIRDTTKENSKYPTVWK